MPPKKRGNPSTSPDTRPMKKVAASNSQDKPEALVPHKDTDSAKNENTLIQINVGGKVITTLVSTLLSSKSHFTEWIANKFSDFPKDKDGNPFIDRDSNNFLYILNFFRGYGIPSKADRLVCLAEDAVYYNITELLSAIGAFSPAKLKFPEGPGVSRDGLEFCTAAILNTCGKEPFVMATDRQYRIRFRVLKAAVLAVGVVGMTDVKYNTHLFSQTQSVAYDNSGNITCTLGGGEKTFSAAPVYKTSDEVGITVSFQPLESKDHTRYEALIAFQNGEGNPPYEVKWPDPPPLQFATSLHDISCVVITSSGCITQS